MDIQASTAGAQMRVRVALLAGLLLLLPAAAARPRTLTATAVACDEFTCATPSTRTARIRLR
jgi:hypothetical protein